MGSFRIYFGRIKAGIIASIIVSLIVAFGLALSIVFNNIETDFRYQILYRVHNNESTGPAFLIKEVLGPDKTGLNKINLIKQLREIDSRYLDLILNEESLLRSATNPEFNISKVVQFVDIKQILILYGVGFWLFLSLSTSFSFLVNGWVGVRRWNWKSVWTYIICAISPFLVITAILTLIALAIKKFFYFIVKYILKKKGVDFTAIPQEIKLRLNKIRERSDSVREKYIQICLDSVPEPKAELEKKVDSVKRHLESLGSEIIKYQIQLAGLEHQLDEVKNIPDNSKEISETRSKDFDDLLKIPHVAAVDIEDDEYLSIYTDAVLIFYRDEILKIGFIKISIDMDDKSISVSNLASTHPNNYTHPYAKEDSFCWGQLRGDIGKYLDNMEFPPAVALIMAAIYSSEGDGSGVFNGWERKVI